MTTTRRERAAGAGRASAVRVTWTGTYLRKAALLDCLCALAAGLAALEIRFDAQGDLPAEYLAFTLALPLLWVGSVAVAGGYDPRFIGVGSDEFRKVINAAVSLTAGVAIFSYVAKLNLARGYVVLALPCAAVFDLAARYGLRKRLHKRWRGGQDMRRTVAVGHAAAVEDLVALLRHDSHHGLAVVAACVAGARRQGEVADIPICGGLDSVPSVVSRFNADTVAVLACPEMNGTRLRELAWDLEKTGTEMCVASALLDVAGPRTTIRPVAGLPLLHVDHAELTGAKQVIKGIFDRVSAVLALILLSPLFAVIALAIKLTDHGPVFFRQTRIGKDGATITLWKFRTMVVDAEARRAQLLALNDGHGALFKMRCDPRVTRAGGWLRRWSLDELPQLLNVLIGNMSLVGPRPALPAEVADYGDHMRRRLAVRPGITGLWQVSGRSDLSWDEAERLDIRYVENWSLALDLQILWKTLSAVIGHSGAYLSSGGPESRRRGASPMPSDDDRLAHDLAEAAGQGLLVLRAGGGDPDDLRKAGDASSHEFLLAQLARRRPGDAILSEEGRDDPARLAADRVWIVDPLDGTREFGEPGRTDWAVHVALWERGELTAGAVALPAQGRVLSTAEPPSLAGVPGPAAPAPGAAASARPLRIVVSRSRPPAFASLVADSIGAVLVPLGSAGAKAAAVILGEADAYLHDGGQHEWDSAAPVAVALAAGLHASRLDGSKLEYNRASSWQPDILICPGKLADRLLAAIGAVRPTGPE